MLSWAQRVLSWAQRVLSWAQRVLSWAQRVLSWVQRVLSWAQRVLSWAQRVLSWVQRVLSWAQRPPIRFLGGARVGWVELEFFFKGLGLSNPGCKRRSSRPSFGGASVLWLGAKPYAPCTGALAAVAAATVLVCYDNVYAA